MSKITITLELTTNELLEVAKVLSVSPESHTSLSGPNLCKEVTLPTKAVSVAPEASKPSVPPAPKPGGKKAAKLPAFGRSQEQIDAFIQHEESRIAKLDEEALLKQQRAEEKAAREKEAAKEIETVKNSLTPKTSAPMPSKLWGMMK